MRPFPGCSSPHCSLALVPRVFLPNVSSAPWTIVKAAVLSSPPKRLEKRPLHRSRGSCIVTALPISLFSSQSPCLYSQSTAMTSDGSPTQPCSRPESCRDAGNYLDFLSETADYGDHCGLRFGRPATNSPVRIGLHSGKNSAREMFRETEHSHRVGRRTVAVAGFWGSW